MGGGGESAVAAFEGLEPYLIGRDPARLEEMRFLIANPTASLYNNRTQLLAALEFACLDILGQRWGVPVSEILGGRLRERVPFVIRVEVLWPGSSDSGRKIRECGFPGRWAPPSLRSSAPEERGELSQG